MKAHEILTDALKKIFDIDDPILSFTASASGKNNTISIAYFDKNLKVRKTISLDTEITIKEDMIKAVEKTEDFKKDNLSKALQHLQDIEDLFDDIGNEMYGFKNSKSEEDGMRHIYIQAIGNLSKYRDVERVEVLATGDNTYYCKTYQGKEILVSRSEIVPAEKVQAIIEGRIDRKVEEMSKILNDTIKLKERLVDVNADIKKE